MSEIANFLDTQGRIRVWPAKRRVRLAALQYLAGKFVCGRAYTEKEVNAVIEAWHTFGDYFLLRRELIESALLSRTRDGAQYWRTRPADEISS